jgi:carbonic anhydrase
MPSMTEPADEAFRPSASELVAANTVYAGGFHDAGLQVAPTRQLAVVACMDSRMDMFQILGLANGEAHIIRNAGGVITDDVVRSLCLSQRLLGTREVILVHHTDCGLQRLDAEAFTEELETETGLRPGWETGAFSDPYEDVRHSVERIMEDPFVLHKDHVRGFVYDVTDGLLREVEVPED